MFHILDFLSYCAHFKDKEIETKRNYLFKVSQPVMAEPKEADPKAIHDSSPSSEVGNRWECNLDEDWGLQAIQLSKFQNQ